MAGWVSVRTPYSHTANVPLRKGFFEMANLFMFVEEGDLERVLDADISG